VSQAQGLPSRRPPGQTETVFDGFTETFIDVDGARILARQGGSAADRRAGRMLEMPVLVLWTPRAYLEELYGDPLVIWREWATDVRGPGIDSGHHVAEEAPADLAEAIDAFLPVDLCSVSGPE